MAEKPAGGTVISAGGAEAATSLGMDYGALAAGSQGVLAGGNDRIFGNGGRDCAVWGTEDWGRDTVAATSGTMCLVFSGLKSSDVTSRLSGSTMTFAKATDASQKITVSGWAAETHSVVFASAGAMEAFGVWASAATPTLAQAKEARAEVWKAAGLAVA
ncbi:MAG: hypothetical protein J5863_00845 [Desulfovibrio sp.]|nr:hypothetical protein [Desulfovibrio sp.]